MTFDVSADAYARFMGRFSEPLARRLVDLVGCGSGQSVLDVGCGPGSLTGVLIERAGVENVAALDPSASFVAAVRSRFPGIDVREGTAEDLPWANDTFDMTLAQLVVPFMSDPVQGLREMARVTREAGTVAATAWDHAGGTGPLEVLWAAARMLDPDVVNESAMAGVAEGDLARLFAEAGLTEATSTSLMVSVSFESFDQWWEPYTMGVGPAGAYVAGLDHAQTGQLREQCRRMLPPPPFRIEATAWTVVSSGSRPRE